MLPTAVLIEVIAVALFVVACVVLTIITIVQGFKTSVGWGLICLLVPGGAVVFAFAKTARRALAVALLVSFVGTGVGVVYGSYKIAKTLKALSAAPTDEEKAAVHKGMQEFDKQTKDLDNLDNLQL